MEANAEYENYKNRMEKFPCAFNLVGAEKVTTAKFRSIQHNLDYELDINDNCKNERIIKLNLLTWVRFRLEKQDEAVQLSNEAVLSTERGNIASLGNRFFVSWQTGDEPEATTCLKQLEKMESEHDFDTRLNDALAEQAYYYSRLGGPNSLQRAIQIFSNLPETSMNYLRIFGRGLVYRRITHANIFCSSSEPLTVQEYQKRAAQCLFEVANNADIRLRSLAYAQLATLRRSYPHDLPPGDRSLFHGLGVMQLCEKALEHGEDMPTVLVQCGKAIKPINIDKAIEWLKKSVEIKPNSPAYHHLGICYKRKAEQAACPQNTSEELRHHDYVGQRGADRQVTGQSHYVSRTSQNEHSRPEDGSTVYHSANRAAVHAMEEHPQINRARKRGSNRRGNWNHQPEPIGGRYGQGDYQTRQSSYRHWEVNYQHVPSNFQYQQISKQIGYMVDEYGYASHLPSQVEYTHGYEGYYYTSQMSYPHTQMNHPPLYTSEPFGQAYNQNAYMGVDDGQWDNQNVEVDSAGCVNHNFGNYGAHGSIRDEAVAENMPSVYSYAENHQVRLSGSVPDFENYYTGSVQRVPDTPLIGRNSTHESQGPGWKVPNIECRPGIAGNMSTTQWDAGRIIDVQNMRGRRRNARNRGGFRESGRMNGSHCNPPDATSNFGSIDGRRRSAQGIGLVRGNSQRTGRHIRNSNRNGRTFSGGEWEPKSHLKGSLKRCRSAIPLHKDDENVQEALKYFKKAMEITKENYPAALDLGLLLKETDQVDEALKQFNSITNNYHSSTGHRLIVISAFEQAGLCYLKLSDIKGNADYKEMAKNKLTKAVSMAADLSIIMPELQGSHKEVWVAFTTLLAEIDKEQEPHNRQIEQKIKVLKLAREYWDIVDVIQKLKETGHEELNNPEIIKTALDSYLKLEQPDNALGYHNIVSMNPAVKGSDWWNTNPMRSLRIKVLLHAISGRLREINDSPTVLFQQLFELVFGSCFGLRDPENDQQNDTAPVVLGDVLFVFDTDDSPDEEIRCPAVKVALCLRTLSTCLFGLETQENLKGTGEYGERCSIQLKEMLKYQVVIIVLGDETRNPVFNAMLERVSYNKPEKAPPNQKILVIDAGLQDGKIPQCLQQFKSLKLEDIGILDQLQTAPESWDGNDHISFTEIINHVDVDAVLKLFCFMIEQTWPCP